jgi:hypothetical protein
MLRIIATMWCTIEGIIPPVTGSITVQVTEPVIARVIVPKTGSVIDRMTGTVTDPVNPAMTARMTVSITGTMTDRITETMTGSVIQGIIEGMIEGMTGSTTDSMLESAPALPAERGLPLSETGSGCRIGQGVQSDQDCRSGPERSESCLEEELSRESTTTRTA